MLALAASAAVTLPRAKVGFRQGGAVRPKHDLFQNDGRADRIKAQCVDPRMAWDHCFYQLYIGKALGVPLFAAKERSVLLVYGVYNRYRSAIDRITDILLWLKGDRRGSGHMELYMIVSVFAAANVYSR